MDDLLIPAPIQQVVTGQSGLFTQYNIQKKPMLVHEFQKTSNLDKSVHLTEVFRQEVEMCLNFNDLTLLWAAGSAVPGLLTLTSWRRSSGRTWPSTLLFTERTSAGRCLILWVLGKLREAMWIILVTASSSSQDVPDWNISHLDSILNALEGKCDDKIKAAQGPLIDFGMWKSAFAWHTEEMDLYRLSYMHYGEPRSW